MNALRLRVPGSLLLLGLVLATVSPGLPAADASQDVPVGVWPLQPRPEVVAGFDPPAVPWAAGHRGVDLAGHPGQQVRAALPGRISFSGRIAGKAVVVVDHGPTRTTYEPVASQLPVGTDVTAGHPIGTLELAGSHCFPRACLHWGWLRGQIYLNPLLLVGMGPVRLLPWVGLERVVIS